VKLATLLLGAALLISEVTSSRPVSGRGLTTFVKHFSFTIQSPRPFTFSYPASWSVYRPKNLMGSVDITFAYLGNVRLPVPCTRHPSSVFCSAFRSGPLSRGGVVVSWDSHVVLGAPSVKAVKGIPMKLGVGPAKLSIRSGRAFGCPVGTGRSLSVDVFRTGVSTQFLVAACLRQPGIALHQQQVLAMLNSLHND